MKITPASKQLQAALGCTHEVSITAADLTETTVNTAQTFTITANDGTLFAVIASALKTAFQDASDAAFNTTALIVGDGGDTDRFLASQELNVNGTEIDYAVGASTGYVYNTADTIDFTIAAMAAKALNDIDTGEVVLFVKKIELADLVASATA